MGGGSQDTKSTTVNKPPKWFNDAAIKSLQVADRINQAGYVPYMGNQVAAFTPMQQGAMQSASDWASAANGTGRTDAMAGMPQAKVDGSGIAGYDSAIGFMRNLADIRARFPQQYGILSQFGGDLLANPAQAPRSVTDSPWNVGDEAKKSWDRENATKGGMGQGRYSMSSLLSEGMKDGPFGAMMAFEGLPYFKRQGAGSQGMTSAFDRLARKDMLMGVNPWGNPKAPSAPAIEDPPLPPYQPSGPSWWDPNGEYSQQPQASAAQPQAALSSYELASMPYYEPAPAPAPAPAATKPATKTVRKPVTINNKSTARPLMRATAPRR